MELFEINRKITRLILNLILLIKANYFKIPRAISLYRSIFSV